MKTAILRFLALLAVLLGACVESTDDASQQALPPVTLPGVWTGVFPCDNCPGIDTSLWLRADGQFFIEQHYAAINDGGIPMTAHGLGRWRWSAEERIVVLDGEGPDRIFEQPDAETLLMRTASPLAHRLHRNAAAATFAATIRLSGTARRQGDAYFFKECLTGLDLPLETGGDYSRFRHQFRSVTPRGESASVQLEGRFNWAADGAPQSVHIVRFVTIRDEGGC
jgi:copper homeostasis protein (lipoprotein)